MSQFTLIDGDQRFVACNPSALKHYFHERHILDTENWEGKPNAFHLPRGRQPGIGWLLLLRSDLESINRASQSLSLEIRNGSSTFQINNLTITGARALTGSHEPTSNTIYLVELKDRRAFGEYTAFNAGYNLRDPSHDGGYTASSGAYYRNANWTWATMLQDIASNIPFFAGLSLSNADLPSSPPENYQFRGVPALDTLESLAETLSHYLIVQRNGSLHFVASDYSYPSNALLRGQGLKFLQEASHDAHTKLLPATIQVAFPKRNYAFQNGQVGEPHWNDTFINDPLYIVDIPTTTVSQNASTVSGTKVCLHDTTYARYSDSGSLLNESALQTRAVHLAREYAYATRYSEEEQEYIYSGYWPFECDGEISCISWYDTGFGPYTRTLLSSRKKRACPEVEDRMAFLGSVLPMMRTPQGPHLEHLHEAPIRWGIATLSGALNAFSSVSATIQYATESGGSLSWSDAQDTITIYDVLGNDLPALNPNSQYPTQVYALFHNQVGKWLAIGVPPSSESPKEIIRFKMTSNLAPGGYGTAIRIGSGPAYTTIGTEFPIKDPWTNPGMWRDDTGGSYMGWCYIPDDAEVDTQTGLPVREIIWMEQIARSITFTATEDMDPQTKTMEVSVDSYYLQGKDPGSTLTVHDPQGIFPNALAGSKGKARYNDQENRYEIVACDQRAVLVKATLGTTLCPNDGTAFVINPVNMLFSPYGVMPATLSTAINRYAMAGITGDDVLLAWDDASENYVVIEVEHKIARIITGIRTTQSASESLCASGSSGSGGSGSSGSSSCMLEYKYRDVAVMACDEESGWIPFAVFAPQEVITDWFTEGLSIKGMATQVFVLCACDEYEVEFEQGVDCSGS